MKSIPCFLSDWNTPDTYDTNFADLPNAPAIYCIVAVQLWPDCGLQVSEIAYIGISLNVAKRLIRGAHDAIKKVEAEGLFAQRYFKICPRETLRSRELELIRLFSPRLNTQGRLPQ